MKKLLMALTVLFISGARVWAGPNEGGILVVHNTGIVWTTDLPLPPESPVPACEDWVGGVPFDAEGRSATLVWKVYAAFSPSSSPRLKGCGWGISYPGVAGGQVVIEANGAPTGAFCIQDGDWPNDGSSIAMSFTDSVRTTPVTELYWFSGYGVAGSNGEPQTFATYQSPNASNWGFYDDAVPVNTDSIAAYGGLGFGWTYQAPGGDSGDGGGDWDDPCTRGACCRDDLCLQVTYTGCTVYMHGVWHGGSCYPDPCRSAPTVGACCKDGYCHVEHRIDCTNRKGTFQGEGTTCNLTSCMGGIVGYGDWYYENQPWYGPPVPNWRWLRLAGGTNHSLGLLFDGSIIGWGYNDYGQCNVPLPNTDFVSVASGGDFGLGLKVYGSIVAWGDNSEGQCNVPSPNAGFEAVAAGLKHSLGLKSDGTILAWGRNGSGQCNVPAPNSDFVAVAGGRVHSLGLKSDGTIIAWGANFQGQCNVPAPNADFVEIAGGGAHSLGLKSDGTIIAWGNNDQGQCNVPSPNADFVAIAAGLQHSLGLKSDGTIVAWGNNAQGQCDFPEPNGFFVTIAAGYFHSMGARSEYWVSGTDDPVPQATSGADLLRILSVRPNPVAASAEISFEASESGPVNMTVHDIGGRQVVTSALGSFGPGRHQVRWDTRNGEGLRLTSGVYFLRLQGVAGGTSSLRMLVIR